MAIDLSRRESFWVLEYGPWFMSLLPYLGDAPRDEQGRELLDKRPLPLFSSEALARTAIPQRIDPRFGEPFPKEEPFGVLQQRLREYWTMGIDEAILDGFQPDGSTGESDDIFKLSLRMEKIAGGSS